MPIIDGKFVQPWRVPDPSKRDEDRASAARIIAGEEPEPEEVEDKPAVEPEAEDETMQSVTKRRIQARKLAGDDATGNDQAKAAKKFDRENRSAAQETLKEVKANSPEDLSDVGLNEG